MNISSCPRNIRENSYKSLVRPQGEYASTVWDTSFKSQVAAVDAVQRRSARYIIGDYRQEGSVTAMLQQLHLDSPQTRRLRARAIMMYRVVKHLIAYYNQHLFSLHITSPEATPSVSFSQHVTLDATRIPSTRLRSPSRTNALPHERVDADSLEALKHSPSLPESAHTTAHRKPCIYPVVWSFSSYHNQVTSKLFWKFTSDIIIKSLYRSQKENCYRIELLPNYTRMAALLFFQNGAVVDLSPKFRTCGFLTSFHFDVRVTQLYLTSHLIVMS